jgi:predicted histidine transporter YuiF (NhaC family)
LEENWPIIIPPLLALIDDAWTPNKVHGCELLTLFLETCPSVLLQRTGLGEVFESALMQYLLYIPTLVTETVSLQILGAVYPTLICLNRARYPDEKDRRLKLKGLDRIMREGVFKGYAHAGEKVRIAEILVKQMIALIDEMDINCAKHLKVRPTRLWKSARKTQLRQD